MAAGVEWEVRKKKSRMTPEFVACVTGWIEVPTRYMGHEKTNVREKHQWHEKYANDCKLLFKDVQLTKGGERLVNR